MFFKKIGYRGQAHLKFSACYLGAEPEGLSLITRFYFNLRQHPEIA